MAKKREGRNTPRDDAEPGDNDSRATEEWPELTAGELAELLAKLTLVMLKPPAVVVPILMLSLRVLPRPVR